MKIKIFPTEILITIDPQAQDTELALIHQLPGHHFIDDDNNSCIVPIRVGLSKYFSDYNQISEVLKQYEDKIIDENFAAPQISVNDLWNVPANTAINMAVNYHMYKVHRGDRQDYDKNHEGYKFGG